MKFNLSARSGKPPTAGFAHPDVEGSATRCVCVSAGGVLSLPDAQAVFQCFALNPDKAQALFHSATTANQLMGSPANTPPGTLGQE